MQSRVRLNHARLYWHLPCYGHVAMYLHNHASSPKFYSVQNCAPAQAHIVPNDKQDSQQDTFSLLCQGAQDLRARLWFFWKPVFRCRLAAKLKSAMYMHSISRELTNKADRRNGRKVTTMLHKKNMKQK